MLFLSREAMGIRRVVLGAVEGGNGRPSSSLLGTLASSCGAGA